VMRARVRIDRYTLTRDGALRPAKISLLDYALGVARDPAVRSRTYVVPVGINYDRVLENRTTGSGTRLSAVGPRDSIRTYVAAAAGGLSYNGYYLGL